MGGRRVSERIHGPKDIAAYGKLPGADNHTVRPKLPDRVDYIDTAGSILPVPAMIFPEREVDGQPVSIRILQGRIESHRRRGKKMHTVIDIQRGPAPGHTRRYAGLPLALTRNKAVLHLPIQPSITITIGIHRRVQHPAQRIDPAAIGNRMTDSTAINRDKIRERVFAPQAVVRKIQIDFPRILRLQSKIAGLYIIQIGAVDQRSELFHRRSLGTGGDLSQQGILKDAGPDRLEFELK